MKLSARQQKFVDEYLIDLNATQAAIRAGYSKKTANEQASRLLANVNIKNEIEKLRKEQSERTKIDADWVLKNLVELAQICMLKKKTPKGRLLGRFDSSGARGALELIGKHFAMFKDKMEIVNDAELDDKLDRIIDALRRDKAKADGAGKKETDPAV